MQIGQYTVIRKLGKGGMGSVYKVRQPESDTFFAMKILDPFEIMIEIIGLPALKKIFFAEAHMMQQIGSTAVVRVFDIGEDSQGRPFFVMEFFCKNLGEMLGEGFWMDKMSRIIPPAMVLYYGRELLTGLATLHRDNLIHRDIKPFNILLDNKNRVKICDFGMAVHNGNSPVGNANMIIGSPFYAAPEQNSQAADVDGRSDLYSVAVIIFRMLTGAFPSKKYFPLSNISPYLNKNWDAFLKKGLRRPPEKRFANCSHMLNELEELQYSYEKESTLDNWPGFAKFPTRLRNTAKNIAGKRGVSIPWLSDQMQPLFFSDAPLHVAKDGTTITDPFHTICWQRFSSKEQLTIDEAKSFVQQLNKKQPLPTASWRIPTLEELLTLLRPGKETLLNDLFPDRPPWLWSCDRYGNLDYCYLDCGMGFVGHQDRHCRHHLLAVTSLS